MIESARRARNAERLADCHIWFRDRMARVIASLEQQGRRPRIQDAWRSQTDQLAALSGGFSQVTYGFHNVTGPGGRRDSFAVDILDDDDPLDRDDREPGSVYYLMLAAEAEKVGLQTLIRWGLSADDAARVDRAIGLRDFHAPVRIGKDPAHVQPGPESGITLRRLQGGWRPEQSGNTPLGAAVDTTGLPAGQAIGTAPVAAAAAPTSDVDMQTALSGFYPDWGQLDQDLKRAGEVGISHLTPEKLARVMDFPYIVLEAARARVMKAAAAKGITDPQEAINWYLTYFRLDALNQPEAREHLLYFWKLKR